MTNKVLIDWFSATIKTTEKSPFEAVKVVITELLLMKIEQFTSQSYGINRYNGHFSCGDIKVYYSVNERTGKLSQKMGIFVQMTGQGCRQYEEYLYRNENNWVALLQRFVSREANFTRVDIANDVFDKSLNVPLIYDYCKKGLCISQSKKYQYFETGVLESGEIIGETINIGVKGSDSQQLSIYNKKMEQTDNGKQVDVEDWIRCELRLFGKKANAFANLMIEQTPLAILFFGLVNQGYRFVLDDEHSKDKNKRRRPTVNWWSEYLATKEKTILEVERKKRTLEKSERFLDKQSSKTLAMVYHAKAGAFGDDMANQYILGLIAEGEKRLTDKDKELVDQYIQEQQSGKYWGTVKRD